MLGPCPRTRSSGLTGSPRAAVISEVAGSGNPSGSLERQPAFQEVGGKILTDTHEADLCSPATDRLGSSTETENVLTQALDDTSPPDKSGSPASHSIREKKI